MSDSLLLTIIYTIGHFVIAALCVNFITSASLELTTIDALVEPSDKFNIALCASQNILKIL